MDRGDTDSYLSKYKYIILDNVKRVINLECTHQNTKVSFTDKRTKVMTLVIITNSAVSEMDS